MISKIELGNFRCFETGKFEFSKGINVIDGKNGCGKTSVLESVNLLCQGISFRTRDLKEAVRWGNDEFIVRGSLGHDSEIVERGILAGRCRTQARENGSSLRSPVAFFGNFPTVAMQPSDIELLRGSPEVRRRWLDEILCYRSKANETVLRSYRRILLQRNQWLKQFKREGFATGGNDLFYVLTEQLVEWGVKLWIARLELSTEISPIITSYYRRLSRGNDEITCDYKSSIIDRLDAMDSAEFLSDESIDAIPSNANTECLEREIPSEGALKNAFTARLVELEFAEKSQGLTLTGPHKDDLSLCASGFPMRSVGSQGQCRSAAIAMRFAAVDVASIYRNNPILLLDDIFAELDVDRRDAVASLISEKECQMIVATPEASELPFRADTEIRLQ